MGNIYFGSDLKLLLSIELPKDFKGSINDVDFDITIVIGKKNLKFNKSDLIYLEKEYFLICIKAEQTCKGDIKGIIKVTLKDGNFSDGKYVIIQNIDTNIQIV